MACTEAYKEHIMYTFHGFLVFDEIYTIDSVDAQLQSTDVVIITLPGTAETAGMFDAERIKKMKARLEFLKKGTT
ncbi:MAG: hypothetical protein HDR01_15255 [Lachnospiraceae bacterium]|nr:hypothetical protein [Lachnospiraceae bacterium]